MKAFHTIHKIKIRLLSSALFLLLSFSAYPQSWYDVAGGMNDFVNAMTVYNNELIVGGRFTSAGGVPANYIAKWNGTYWSPLGSGVDGWVWALTVYNGELIVGGQFTTAGGLPVSNVARWNGSSWNELSGGTSSIVASLTVYNGKLIAGGYFLDAEGLPLNHIGAWDENGWYALGAGTGGSQGQVMALTVQGTDLIAGGFFTTAGGSPANHIAKWNGTSWSAVGTGINSIVYSLGSYQGNLIAGGLFSNAGGVPAKSIASWNGSSWDSLSSGMGATGVGYDYVFALENYNSKLFAGGMYLTAGSVIANGIASWNGSAWADLDGGVWFGSANAYGVNALCVYQGSIYAGGVFTSAGSIGAAHIARWYEVPLDVSELNSTNSLYAFPNPFKNYLTLQGTRGGGIIEVHDMYGRVVYIQRSNEVQTILYLNHLLPGFYTVKYIQGNIQSVLKVVRVGVK